MLRLKRQATSVCRALVGAFVLTTALAPVAAAKAFTIDHRADSIGPVAIDPSGNGYVAWLHRVGAGDVDMFCKLAPGADKCSHPITLNADVYDGGSTDTPFPVLGPNNSVFVVAPSYDSGQMIMWESTNGGASFGSAYVGPSNSVLSDGLDYTDTCNVALDLDDVLSFNALGEPYDPSQGSSTVGTGGLEFNMSSAGPFATWSFDFYGEPCAVSSSTTVTPGRIPAQWFGFDDGGIADAGIATDQTTLGWAGGGIGECPGVAQGDEVEAFANGSSPNVEFFRWSAPVGPCSTSPGRNYGTDAARNWFGPGTVTGAQFPRLAGGKAGLFLLSGDSPSGQTGVPTVVDVRRYSVASHSFDAPERLTGVVNRSGLDPDAGGLGENFVTGELAAVWPDVGGDTHLLSLFVSTDGGAHFSKAVDIARIDPGYAGLDNARVAVAADGNGLVTWLDSGGLHVAYLQPIAASFERLIAHSHSLIKLQVTCQAPKGSCKASVQLEHKGVAIASVHHRVPSGQTATLRVPLNANGRSLLSAAGGHLKATLTLVIRHPGIKPTRLVVPTVIT